MHDASNPTPDQAAEKKPGKAQQAIAGLRGQNEPATFEGREGFWVQASCIFIPGKCAATAVMEYRRRFEANAIACSHNHFCDGILREKERFEQEVDNASVLPAEPSSQSVQPG